jgi:hypothetical protein
MVAVLSLGVRPCAAASPPGAGLTNFALCADQWAQPHFGLIQFDPFAIACYTGRATDGSAARHFARFAPRNRTGLWIFQRPVGLANGICPLSATPTSPRPIITFGKARRGIRGRQNDDSACLVLL